VVDKVVNFAAFMLLADGFRFQISLLTKHCKSLKRWI